MRTARALTWLGVLAAIVVATGCGDDSGSSGLLVQMVSPTGDNPAAEVVSGTLSVEVRQGDRVLSCGGGRCDTPIVNGVFDLTFPIESFTEITRIHARIVGGPRDLIGATPIFSPFGESLDEGLAVRVVMGEAGTCQSLTVPSFSSTGRIRLSTPRRDAAVVIRRNLALVVGGTEAAGAPSGRVDRVDQVVIQNVPLDPIPEGVGPARGLTLSEDDSLILGDGRVIMYRLQTGPPLATVGAELHAGGGFASALTALDSMRAAGGVAIAGGLDGAAPVAEVTWLDANGARTGIGTMATARAFAVARDVPGALVVVGGAASGELNAERHTMDDTMDDAVAFAVPEGSGGYLARSPSGRTLLWIGWADASGAASEQTVLLRDCATGCVVDPDPPRWDRARLDTAGVETAAGAFWIVGGTNSAFIDRVVWDDESPSIEEGPDLASEAPERAGATVFEHASGIVTVAGGEGPHGLRDDIELCFPDALDPI